MTNTASKKREVLTLSISPQEKANLEAIALSLNCTWGTKPNVSRLMAKIADGSFNVVGAKPENSDKGAKGRKAIQLIAKGLLELSIVLFGLEKNEH